MRTTLTQVERRLQNFIEDSIARLFPSEKTSQAITSALLNAMKSAARPDENGNLVAPGAYIVRFPARANPEPVIHHQLVQTLTKTLLAGGENSGITFDGPIEITFATTAKVNGEISVEPQSLEDSLENTQYLPTSKSRPQPEESPPSVKGYLILPGGTLYPLKPSVTNIGRASTNHLVLDDPRVSRSHAQIRKIRGHFTIFDLNSRGGTLVNGRKIRKKTLQPGDTCTFGETMLIFGLDEPDEHSQTQQIPKDKQQ